MPDLPKLKMEEELIWPYEPATAFHDIQKTEATSLMTKFFTRVIMVIYMKKINFQAYGSTQKIQGYWATPLKVDEKSCIVFHNISIERLI